MFPERIYKGATVIISGQARKRDGRPFPLFGYSVFLYLRDASSTYSVQGAVVNAELGKFTVTIPKTLSASFSGNRVRYELVIKNDSEDFVCDQGEIDLLPRLV
jgi:hypothetical protein